MNEGLARYEGQPLTIAEIKSEVKLIQDILEHIMIKDVHYGTIPGTPKPALYKPGSEKILRTFHIGVDPREDITDLSTDDEIRYRVYVKGFNQATGEAVGVGVGECSSNEEKYKWRKPVCDEEFDETPDDRKRVVWKRGRDKNYQQKQVRTNPADLANTILKMAKKRSQIDMTLTVTAASDVFEQDLEDMPDEVRETLTEQNGNKKPDMKAPTEKQPEADAQTVNFIPQDVTIKEGKTGNKPWTKYFIKGPDGEYNTFDKKFADEAYLAKEADKLISVTYKAGKYGNEIVSLGEATY